MQENLSQRKSTCNAYTCYIYTHTIFNLETSKISVEVCTYVFVSMYMYMCEGGLRNQKGMEGPLEEPVLATKHLSSLPTFFFNNSLPFMFSKCLLS